VRARGVHQGIMTGFMFNQIVRMVARSKVCP
jgi:hypothetical protein